jgi:2-succinyl-5-enolpyruvyl-6-hydroxy-3-cyclohexene-1-carboxylate synthase
MAFRDHDLTWRPKDSDNRARVWVNRGLNGIDGTLSSALGVALATHTSVTGERRENAEGLKIEKRAPHALPPLIVWLGDLAAHHDLQGLHALAQWRSHEAPTRPVVIVLTNNNGGGIFYHLPINQSERFKRLFVTPQHADPHDTREVSDSSVKSTPNPWVSVAAWSGAEHRSVSDRSSWERALEEAARRPALTLIEVTVDAALDHELHLKYWRDLIPTFMSELQSLDSEPRLESARVDAQRG